MAGTVFDFRIPRAVGDRVRDARDEQIAFGRGYDHNWVVTDAVTPGTHLMARVEEPVSASVVPKLARLALALAPVLRVRQEPGRLSEIRRSKVTPVRQPAA